MMRSLILTSLLLISCVWLLAAPVPEATILQVAENWLGMYTGIECTVDNYELVTNASAEIVMYRIDFLPDGFVLIAADDSSIPILAYSETGSILDFSNPAREELIGEYSAQLTDIKANNLSNAETLPVWTSIISKASATELSHSIGLNTNWDQNSPYNNLCPKDSTTNSRSLVGCVATATSQILNYFKFWDYSFSSVDSYISDYNGFITHIDADAVAHNFPNFNTLNTNMSSVISKFNSDQTLTSTDLASLCFATGVLEHMGYSSSASGSSINNAKNAYTKLKYNATLAIRSTYSSPAWNDMIVQDLDAYKPVQYRGVSAQGGHAFILCGYRTVGSETHFQVNWGWGPSYNGQYYSLNALNAGGYSFVSNQMMLHGIKPRIIINQSVTLSDGATSLTGITLKAQKVSGAVSYHQADLNGLIDIDLPSEGLYNLTFYHQSNAYIPYSTGYINMHNGLNVIQTTPIVLQRRPSIVIVPTHAPTIQEGIDMVADGGTVVILDGNYTVSELSWEDKHISLRGATINGVTLTSNYSPAINLEWSGINNTDIIQNITFQDCENICPVDGGAAITLNNGASPQIIACHFINNSVGMPYSLDELTFDGTGGAVFVGGAENQTSRPKFLRCNFTDNFTNVGTGGGAVALYGVAEFSSCTFDNNYTTVPVGCGPPDNKYTGPCINAGGAVLINTQEMPGEIIFQSCTFINNLGMSEADDIFVWNVDNLDVLRVQSCTFKKVDPDYRYNQPSIMLLRERFSEPYSQDMHAHFLFKNNSFINNDKGAVYYHDYQGKNPMTFINNVVANNENDGYGFYLSYYGTAPQNPDYFKFDNNTFKNIRGKGLVLYQGNVYTLNNNVFDNCSQYGVYWGGYDSGFPQYATQGLIVNNCIFTDLSPQYDHTGTGNFTLTENSVMVVANTYLDANYRPIWTASIMSPCIDTGIGDPDPDGTPRDIGAIRAVDHRYWEYSFENQADRDRWYWVSYPVLNTITDNALQASVFFEELLHIHKDSQDEYTPTYLHSICWMVEGEPESIAWYNEDWTSTQFTHYVSSPQGYKIKLLQGVPDTVTFTESGFKTPDNLQFPIYGGVENWLGYFCEESRMPQDAFAAIWDDITMVRTKDWCLYRDPNGGLGKVAGIILPINYGDMVIVTTMNDHSFRWGSSNPVPPHSKSRSESFIYDEKADYIPVYINIPEDMQMDLKEIGLYLDGICKGAVVIDSDYEQISAYVDSPDELINSDLELVFHYDDSKRPDSELRATSYHPGKMQPQYGFSGARYPFYEISISQKDLDNIKPPVFGLNQNYPNPFNPITTISYSMPEAAKVRLDIYNLKGQLVKTLIDSEMEAGPHSVVWNGKDGNNQAVASGIYFYRLSSPNNTQTKRMLLMK